VLTFFPGISQNLHSGWLLWKIRKKNLQHPDLEIATSRSKKKKMSRRRGQHFLPV
jgi:hypothetical protein